MKTFSNPCRRALAALLTAVISLVTPPNSHAAAGDLDPLNLAIVGNVVMATAVQPDGKTIIAGTFTSVLGQPRNHIARLNTDGTLDTGFNPKPNSGVECVAVQADGKILLGGGFTTLQPNGAPSPTVRNYIARVNADGTLDTGFDPWANNYVNNVVVQADGKILLAGEFTTLQPNGAASTTPRRSIARVNADGTLDTGFDPKPGGGVECVAVQTDGKILLGGYFFYLQPNGATGEAGRSYVARVNSDGTLDAGFDPNADGAVLTLAVQADGKILLGGGFTTLQPNGAASATTRQRVARLNEDGTLDTGFNPRANNFVNNVVVQADGKILLAGEFTTLQPNGAASTTPRQRIARVNADGTLDTGFDPKANGVVYSVAVQADGKIHLGGYFTTLQPNGAPSATTRNFFARLVNDPATQVLSALDTNLVSWTRSGSSPELSQVTLENSTDSGTTWTLLGRAIRVGITSNWQLTGLSLPATGQVRARGRTAGGASNGSSGLVQATASYSGLLTPAPTVTSITPATGSNLGGTVVTVTGTSFTGATGVTFGGTAATSFTVNSPSQITATTPAGATGAVSVLVTTPRGINSANTLYTYVTAAPPTVTSVTPGTGSTLGRTSVMITGTNFTGASNVSFGGKAATAFTVNSASQITASTPAHPAGAVSVLVASPAGTNPENSLYSYQNIDGVPGTGDLDPLNPAVVGTRVMATAVQPDGKTIIAGTFTSVLGQPRNHIARLNADGTLDMGFNPKPNDEVYGVAVQADGKILLGGAFTDLQPNGAANATSRQRIARVNADGTLDMGFDPKANGRIYSIAIQADGKMLIGGNFTTLQPNGAASASGRVGIARLNANGTLDTSFSFISVNSVNVSSMAVQSDGRVLIGGYFTSVNGTARRRIARVNADGTLDTGFDPNANGSIACVAVQADGKILLGGWFTTLQPNGAASATLRRNIARVNSDGTLDTGFDPKANSDVKSLALQADGKILLGGQFSTLQPYGLTSATTRYNLARLNVDGSLDTTFDPAADRPVWSVAVQTDGKVMLGGYFTTLQPFEGASASARNQFARLLNDPATQTLSAVDATQVNWTRGGSSPELSQVTFENSADNGVTWTLLGHAARVGTTPNWRLTGLSLPASGKVRARGRTAGGYLNGSSGLVETTLSYGAGTPEIVVIGNGVTIADGDSTPSLADHTDFGSVALINTQVSRHFTLANHGDADLSLTGIPAVAVTGTHASDFKVTQMPSSELGEGETSAFKVTFDPALPGLRTAMVSIASNDPERDPFTFAVSGSGGISKLLPQSITFTAPSSVFLGQGGVNLIAEASSGLPVTLELGTGPAALEGSVLTPTGTGTVAVRATQAGDGHYAVAKTVTRSIVVKANPTILTLTDLSQRYDGTPKVVGTVGAVGGVAISYQIGGVFGPTAPSAAGRYPVRALIDGVTKTGTLVIAKAPLYVVPHNKRKFAGEVNPPLTHTYEGFVGVDDAGVLTSVPVLSTTAKLTSPGGTYPITVKGGAAANYALLYRQGTLVVESFAAGYEALLVDNSSVPHGKLSLRVEKSGRSFSGSMALAGELSALRFSGPLVITAIAEIGTGESTVIKNGVAYGLSLTFPMYGAVTAQVTRNGASLAQSNDGRRLLELPQGGKVGYSGPHTVVLEPATFDSMPTPVPAGAGWARATINTRGAIALVGKLGDGTAFTTTLLPDVQETPGYRFWVQPYKPARTGTFLGGEFAVSQHPLHSRGLVAEETTFAWAKAKHLADQGYPDGFSVVDVGFTLDPWLPPTTSTPLATLLGLTGETINVDHSATGSDSDEDLPTTVTLNTRNVINVPGANDTHWKTTLNTLNGTFTGSFELLDAGKKRLVPFSGVLRQPMEVSDPMIGDGHFVLPPLPGAVPAVQSAGEVLLQRP